MLRYRSSSPLCVGTVSSGRPSNSSAARRTKSIARSASTHSRLDSSQLNSNFHYSHTCSHSIITGASIRYAGAVGSGSATQIFRCGKSVSQFAVVALLLIATSPLIAQTGQVRVRITDPLGAKIFDAPGSFRDKGGNVIREARSDRTGEVLLANLPVGEGRVELAVPGFRPVTYTDVKVGSDSEVVLNVQLQQMVIHVDYDGGRLPRSVKRVRIRVTNSAGLPIRSAHGWVVSDTVGPIVTADDNGQLLFQSVPPYPGIAVVANGFSSAVVQLKSDAGSEMRVNVVLN